MKSIRNLGASVPNSAAGKKPPSGPNALSQRRIAVAIVDDHERAHLLIQAILAETQDFRWVASYFSGEAALMGIRQSCAQIVLMDVKMPGMYGYDLFTFAANA